MPYPFLMSTGQRFRCLAPIDVVEPIVWQETVLVRTGRDRRHPVDVSDLGRWMAHCHISEHHEQRMHALDVVNRRPSESRRLCREPRLRVVHGEEALGEKPSGAADLRVPAPVASAAMRRAVLFAVDGDAAGLRDVERELLERYARDYEVVCLASATEARTRLGAFAEDGTPVALVLAAAVLAGGTGPELLADARHLHPHAKRALLIGWGEWGDSATGDAISEATVHGHIDHYLVRPLEPPDEAFHQAISSFLLEWAEDQRVAPHAVRVVGDAWSGRGYELRSVLERCAFPHRFSLADSPEGAAVLADVTPNRPLPVVVMPDGTALHESLRSRAVAGQRITPCRR